MKNKKIALAIFSIVAIICITFLSILFKYQKEAEKEAEDFSLQIQSENTEDDGSFSVEEAINKPLGLLYVPKIDLKIPIYKYNGEFSISHGAGILQGNLLGKEKEHTIITSHNGDVFRDLFTNIGKLEKEDIFYVENEGADILSFKVIHKKEVSPENEIESFLKAKDGQSLFTLRTCVPIGINTKRLHVTGEFTGKVNKSQMQNSEISLSFFQKSLIIILAISLLAVGYSILTIKRDKKNRKGELNERKNII